MSSGDAYDPFPMRSQEAAKLAASVEGSSEVASNVVDGERSKWNDMNSSVGASPSSSAIEMSRAIDASKQQLGSGLIGGGGGNRGRRMHRNDDYDWNYANDDKNDDERGSFFDRPLNQSPLSMLETIILKLYGPSLPVSEFFRVLTLSGTLFFLIGGYWLLRSLKDPVLTAICGITAIPKAKMLSVVIVLLVVTVYNRLLDTDIPKHRLFFLFGTFYFLLFATIALLLTHPTIGLKNQQPSFSRLLGWVSYCSIESFGSVMVSLFWSFTNSNTSLETKKAGYGLLVAMAQIGSILGPTIVNRKAKTWGTSKCYFAGACSMLCLQGTMWFYLKIYGNTVVGSSKESAPKKKSAGILEGLTLFWEHNYIKGIFAISCLFMVEVTIVDYTMKVLARDDFSNHHPCIDPNESCYGNTDALSEAATNEFTTFMGLFGQATNTLSLILSLFGTSAVIRKLGLRLTLLLFPSLCLVIICWIRVNPTLWTVFGSMMLLKACSYSLNNPTKEILYQPTSDAVKYKAKSWIDIFGARGSKALGSVVTNAFSESASELVQNGSLVGMAVASFLIWNATFMGRLFDEYTESGVIVGNDKEHDSEDSGKKNLEMAMAQNEIEDTSCAIDDGKDDNEDEANASDDEDDEECEAETEKEESIPRIETV